LKKMSSEHIYSHWPYESSLADAGESVVQLHGPKTASGSTSCLIAHGSPIRDTGSTKAYFIKISAHLFAIKSAQIRY